MARPRYIPAREDFGAQNIQGELKNLKGSLAALVDDESAEIDEYLVDAVIKMRAAADEVAATVANGLLARILKGASNADVRRLEEKKARNGRIANLAKRFGCVLIHPETRRPCNLYVVPSPDGYGRYVLEDKETKKRSMTSSTLGDLKGLAFAMPERKAED